MRYAHSLDLVAQHIRPTSRHLMYVMLYHKTNTNLAHHARYTDRMTSTRHDLGIRSNYLSQVAVNYKLSLLYIYMSDKYC